MPKTPGSTMANVEKARAEAHDRYTVRGESPTDIARAMGVSRQTVYGYLKATGSIGRRAKPVDNYLTKAEAAVLKQLLLNHVANDAMFGQFAAPTLAKLTRIAEVPE